VTGIRLLISVVLICGSAACTSLETPRKHVVEQWACVKEVRTDAVSASSGYFFGPTGAYESTFQQWGAEFQQDGIRLSLRQWFDPPSDPAIEDLLLFIETPRSVDRVVGTVELRVTELKQLEAPAVFHYKKTSPEHWGLRLSSQQFLSLATIDHRFTIVALDKSGKTRFSFAFDPAVISRGQTALRLAMRQSRELISDVFGRCSPNYRGESNVLT